MSEQLFRSSVAATLRYEQGKRQLYPIGYSESAGKTTSARRGDPAGAELSLRKPNKPERCTLQCLY
jgi:hypothetical protein